jgi:hypothetical protein
MRWDALAHRPTVAALVHVEFEALVVLTRDDSAHASVIPPIPINSPERGSSILYLSLLLSCPSRLLP